MVAVPVATPVTTPVLDATVATAVFELVQVPPVVVLARVVVDPTQVVAVPVIAFGLGLTETTAVCLQPVDSV
jgi:hypothetical protein